MEWLRPSPACSDLACDGPPLHSLWPPLLADLLINLARRAISIRGLLDSEFLDGDRCCEIQITAQSPDKAICTIRSAARLASDHRSSQHLSGREGLDRRGFMRRFTTSLSVAALNEKPLVVAIIEIDGAAALA